MGSSPCRAAVAWCIPLVHCYLGPEGIVKVAPHVQKHALNPLSEKAPLGHEGYLLYLDPSCNGTKKALEG